MSESKNVYQRINAIMSELSYVKKTGKIGYGQNTYTAVLHDHVTQQLQPLCVKHGVVLVPSMIDTTIKKYTVTTKKGESDRYETMTTAEIVVVNIDKPDETFTTQATAHSFDNQDKSTGKAYSMAVKYCYLKLFMLASGDEEEDRVETSKIITDEKKLVSDKLITLLKAHDKYNENTIGFIRNMSIEQLSEKIKEYSSKENK